MKITKLEPIVWFKEGFPPYIYARVHTDDGLVGLGEAGFTPNAWTINAYLEDLADQIVGRDPRDIEALWQFMTRQPYERGGPVIQSAVAAVDIALWDLAGKRLDQPVHRLLGGPVRDRIRVYTNVVMTTDDLDNMAKHARQQVSEGYTALRLYLPEDLVDAPLDRMVHDMTGAFSAVRDAVGPDVDLCIDVHRRQRIWEAITLARALEPFNLLFLEDPIMAENMEAMVEVARSTSVPIATGENLYTLYQFRDLFARRGVKFARIDLCLAGGITLARKVAALAEAEYVGVIPHQPWSPVATAAYAQFSATIPNLVVQEYYSEQEPPKRDLVDQPLTLEAGALLLPDRPGIGIELQDHVIEQSKELLAQRPKAFFKHPTLARRDGAYADW